MLAMVKAVSVNGPVRTCAGSAAMVVATVTVIHLAA